MLQVIMFVIAAAVMAALLVTIRRKGPRVKALRISALAMALCLTGAGAALTPAPLTAADGVQYANFIKVDITETEDMDAKALQAFPDGNFILTEEAADGRFVRFILAEDGVEYRIPGEEAVFAMPDAFGYDVPVMRYGCGYVEGNKLLTFMNQRWEFVHFIVGPEYFGIWQG